MDRKRRLESALRTGVVWATDIEKHFEYENDASRGSTQSPRGPEILLNHEATGPDARPEVYEPRMPCFNYWDFTSEGNTEL